MEEYAVLYGYLVPVSELQDEDVRAELLDE